MRPKHSFDDYLARCLSDIKRFVGDNEGFATHVARHNSTAYS